MKGFERTFYTLYMPYTPCISSFTNKLLLYDADMQPGNPQSFIARDGQFTRCFTVRGQGLAALKPVLAGSVRPPW
jgi:hypothetical protein